jgi:hypothetical protein
MRLTISNLTIETNLPYSFSLLCGKFDSHIKIEPEQPFWWFSTRRDDSSMEFWFFGIAATFCWLQPGQFQGL